MFFLSFSLRSIFLFIFVNFRRLELWRRRRFLHTKFSWSTWIMLRRAWMSACRAFWDLYQTWQNVTKSESKITTFNKFCSNGGFDLHILTDLVTEIKLFVLYIFLSFHKVFCLLCVYVSYDIKYALKWTNNISMRHSDENKLEM